MTQDTTGSNPDSSGTPNTMDSFQTIVTVTSTNFEAEVMDASQRVTVVLDFWAPWCQPCLMLAPILEAVVTEAAGRIRLGKIDIDREQALASHFRIQGIPHLVVIRRGGVVDQITGLLNEPQLRAWLDRHTPSSADLIVEEARTLESENPQAATVRYRTALDLEPDHPDALVALGRLALDAGDPETARDHLKRRETRGPLDTEAEALRAKLDLTTQAEGLDDLDALRQRVGDDPRDGKARFELAEALASASQYEEALGLALALVEEFDPDYKEPSRQLMLRIFSLLPADSPLSTTYRQRLSAALF